MKTISRLIKRYPIQTLLILFNLGVFTWAQSISSQVSSMIGLDLSTILPEWLIQLIGEGVTQLSQFMSNSSWAWLIVSCLLTILTTMVKGMVKTLMILAVFGIGLYLVWQHQDLLSLIQ